MRLVNLLIPRSGEDFTLKLEFSEPTLEIQHIDSQKRVFYKYTAYLNNDELAELLTCIRKGVRFSKLPACYFETLYLNKLRTAIGFKPNPFNFFNWFSPGGAA